MTLILDIHQDNPEIRAIHKAAEAINEGKIILIPTETGYCFVGTAKQNSTHEAFLKLRPNHSVKKPFSLICKDLSQIAGSAILTTNIYRIATKVLPGPFTFILEASRSTPKLAAGPKRKTVGIRISSHPVMRALIACFSEPLLITSVSDDDDLLLEKYYEKQNENENAWWTDAKRICNFYKNNFDIALNNDKLVPMHVSTIIDFTTTTPTLIRDGGWGLDNLGFI